MVMQSSFSRCLPLLPFWRVPEQVTADLSSIWDHGGVVKKRLVSNLHLEKPLVSGGQLLGQRPQRQQPQQPQQPRQRQQRHTPAFIVPHPVKSENKRFGSGLFGFSCPGLLQHYNQSILITPWW